MPQTLLLFGPNSMRSYVFSMLVLCDINVRFRPQCYVRKNEDTVTCKWEQVISQLLNTLKYSWINQYQHFLKWIRISKMLFSCHTWFSWARIKLSAAFSKLLHIPLGPVINYEMGVECVSCFSSLTLVQFVVVLWQCLLKSDRAYSIEKYQIVQACHCVVFSLF